MAPYGYDNKITDDGKKHIAIVPNEAKVVRWIFEEIAKEVFNSESIYHMAKDRGLTCTKGNFWIIIKNPVYCGKIVVPKYKDEDAMLVNGQHEAIISDGLFYRVQDVLEGRSRNYRPKVQTTENFPLRGFFLCPQCDRKLTGSKCKGRHKYYYYYHCEASCKYRINSEIANERFINHLNTYRPIPEVKKLYSAVLLEAYKEHTGNAASEKKKMLAQITEYEKKLSNARNLLVTEKIDVEDYNLMKADYNSVIIKIEKQLGYTNFEKGDIEDLMSRGLNNLISIGSAYENSTLVEARELIGLIYPENFTFRGSTFQTARVNEILNCIYLVNNELKTKKTGQKTIFSLCPE
ncbi:recombinase family protein [Flavobacterium subsaxonicum]|nr:recombinase family protein [Flavobacterium subsaxonicum]